MIGNWRQRRARLLVAVAICSCGLALARPSIAHAGWPLSAASRVELGFGAQYRAAEATASSTHSGIDIVAQDGASVRAPLAGKVTFAGRVPAVGSGTVRAVTIATASGSVTLLPLASTAVAKGDSLAEGEALGVLAASGDGSSAGTHLHVGVKRGDLYVDPLSVLTLPVAAPAEDAPGASAASASNATAGRAASGVSAHSLGQPRTSAQAAPRAAASASTQQAPLHAATAGEQLAPGVSVAGNAVSGGAVAQGEAGFSAREVPHPMTIARAAAGKATRASGPSVAQLASSLARLAVSATEDSALGVFGVLAALGALWPLWRSKRGEGSGEVSVSAVRDDVAAVVGR